MFCFLKNKQGFEQRWVICEKQNPKHRNSRTMAAVERMKGVFSQALEVLSADSTQLPAPSGIVSTAEYKALHLPKAAYIHYCPPLFCSTTLMTLNTAKLATTYTST